MKEGGPSMPHVPIPCTVDVARFDWPSCRSQLEGVTLLGRARRERKEEKRERETRVFFCGKRTHV